MGLEDFIAGFENAGSPAAPDGAFQEMTFEELEEQDGKLAALARKAKKAEAEALIQETVTAEEHIESEIVAQPSVVEHPENAAIYSEKVAEDHASKPKTSVPAQPAVTSAATHPAEKPSAASGSKLKLRKPLKLGKTETAAPSEQITPQPAKPDPVSSAAAYKKTADTAVHSASDTIDYPTGAYASGSSSVTATPVTDPAAEAEAARKAEVERIYRLFKRSGTSESRKRDWWELFKKAHKSKNDTKINKKIKRGLFRVEDNGTLTILPDHEVYGKSSNSLLHEQWKIG